MADPFWPPQVPFTFDADAVFGSVAHPTWGTANNAQEILLTVDMRPILLTWY